MEGAQSGTVESIMLSILKKMLFGTRDAVEGQQDIQPASPAVKIAALLDTPRYADPEI